MQLTLDHEAPVEPCPFCKRKPVFVCNAGNACGFKCTCGGKRFIHTYYDATIPSDDLKGRIESAVRLWNQRDENPPVVH